jgi:hypothetical protein
MPLSIKPRKVKASYWLLFNAPVTTTRPTNVNITAQNAIEKARISNSLN